MYKLEQVPDDAVSDLNFSPLKQFLAAASWDGTCRIWEFNDSYSNSRLLTIYKEKKEAVLRCCFSFDSETLYYATTKGEIKSVTINKETKGEVPALFSQIKFPITGLKYENEYNVLIASSMFGQLAFADPRSKDNFTIFQDFSKNNVKVVNIDVSGGKIFIALSDNIVWIDMKNPSKYNVVNSGLRPESQRTSIAALPEGRGYIAGCTWGQVEINYLENENLYQFHKVHRVDSQRQMFSSNMVAVSPEKEIGLSVGGDGHAYLFNMAVNKRPRDQKVTTGYPLTACAFSYRSFICALAQGYDWSRGAESYKSEKIPVEITLKKLNNNDIPL